MKAHKRFNKSHWRWVLCSIMVLTSCGGLNKYAQFSPSDDVTIMLKFEYPASWEWVIKDETVMYTLDPLKPTPTPSFSGTQTGPVDIGIIKVIESSESNPYQAMDDHISIDVQSTNILGGSIIRDEIIKIDNIQARLIASRTSPPPEIPQSFEVYQIAVYFCMEYRLYSFFLTVPYDEKDSDFVQGFEHMISTIQVIP